MGDVPVWVGEGPAREGIRTESTVHEHESRLEPFVDQVGVELAQLIAGEHSLVVEGAPREARKVHGRRGLVLDSFAKHEGPAFEFEARERVAGVAAGDYELTKSGFGVDGHAAEAFVVRRDFAPTHDPEFLALDDGVDGFDGRVGRFLFLR